MIDELRWAHDLMTNDIPRVISAGMASRKLYIFTDVALEENDSTGGLGAVAYYSEFGGVVKRFFMASRVPEDVMKLWQTKTAKIISTLELFAAVLSITQLSKMFKHIRVFVFVDNEAARASLISMKSSVCFHLHLLKHVSKIVQVNGIYLWIARVPSSSNPSDSPSRNVWAHLLKEGHARMDVDWCQLRHLTYERKTQVRSVMLRRFLTVCYVHVLRGVWLMHSCWFQLSLCFPCWWSGAQGDAQWIAPFGQKEASCSFQCSTGERGEETRLWKHLCFHSLFQIECQETSVMFWPCWLQGGRGGQGEMFT